MRISCPSAAVLLLGVVVLRSISPALAQEPELVQSRLRLAPARSQVESWPEWPALWLIPSAIARNPIPALTRLELPPALIEELAARIEMTPAPPSGQPTTARIIPDLALLQRFTPEQRGRWHRQLAGHLGNLPSRWPLAVTADALHDLDHTHHEVAARLRAIAIPNGDGSMWHLHDPWALEDVLAADPHRDQAITQLLTARPVWAKFRASGSDFASIRRDAAYWQSQGRFRAIEPILQALGAVTDRDRIDLLHLMPRLPRAVLNSFPTRLDQAPDPTLDNATVAAGFFGGAVEFPASGDFATWLAEHGEPATGERRFGDIVLFEDPARTRWPYAVVYVADGLVFGRRPTLAGPWGFWRMDEMAVLNPRFATTSRWAFRPKAPEPAVSETFTPLPASPRWLQPTTLQPLADGPWGRLFAYDIFLTPSAQLLSGLPAPEPQPAWRFLRWDAETREALLRFRSLTSRQRDQLRQAFAAATPVAGGRTEVRPDATLVASLPPDWRSAAYRLLDSSGGITRYFQEIRVIHALKPEDLPPALAAAVPPLLYPRNGRFAVGDYGMIYHLAENPEDRIALLQTLARTPARIVLLERPAPADIPVMADYWESGGRKDIGQLLSAFAEQENTQFLDVTHLLPSLPREYMNQFTVPLEDRPIPSCYWTALNFSAARPDPRFLVVPGRPGNEVAVVETELKSNYRAIPRPSKPGDVIAYYDRRDAKAPAHVCSYLAADLVFTKNGFGYDAPWCIVPRREVDELYQVPETGVVRYYRRHAAPAQSDSAAK